MRAAHAPSTDSAASDADLVRRVLAGDRGTFAVLVRRHNQRIFRACRAVLRDDEEAEDAAQAAWVSAYRHLSGFRGDAAFSTWVTRIAVHEASARLRRRNRPVRLHRARQALARELVGVFEAALPDVWQFAGDRCARMVDAVMGRIAELD